MSGLIKNFTKNQKKIIVLQPSDSYELTVLDKKSPEVSIDLFFLYTSEFLFPDFFVN